MTCKIPSIPKEAITVTRSRTEQVRMGAVGQGGGPPWSGSTHIIAFMLYYD